MEKQKTAVEWLVDKLNNVKPTQFCSIETIKEWVEQAKKMEKVLLEYEKQKGYTSGWLDGLNHGIEEGNNKKDMNYVKS